MGRKGREEWEGKDETSRTGKGGAGGRKGRDGTEREGKGGKRGMGGREGKGLDQHDYPVYCVKIC